jgi:hypothetical protein
LYVGTYLIQYKCIHCESILFSFDKFIDIPLQSFSDEHRERKIYLNSLLKEFFNVEDFGEFGGILCQGCNLNGIMESQKFILKLPAILNLTRHRSKVIHISLRFNMPG